MSNFVLVSQIVKDIKYKEVAFAFGQFPFSDSSWIQCQYAVVDQGKPRIAKGRRWVIEPDWSEWQIATTALKAVLTLEEHEAREQFLYKGVSVFYPHYDLDEIVRFRAEREAKRDVV